MEFIILIFVIAFGLIIGSFINVIILRMPAEKDIVWQRSACSSCSHVLSWFENIPLFSFLFLKGQCRHCQAKISLQYPIIEIWHGLIAFWCYLAWSTQPVQAVSFFAILAILSAHFMIDLRHQLLLDKLNIALLIPILALIGHSEGWLRAFWGGTLGLLIPLTITWIFYKISGKIGLGGGDIKLFAVIGLLLGPDGVVLNLITSCMLGSIITIILIWRKVISRDEYIPFGPFIIAVVYAQILLPELVRHWRIFLFPTY